MLRKCTKSFFIADLDEKAEILSAISKENETSSIVIIGNDFNFERKFNSKIAGNFLYMHAISLLNGFSNQNYPVSLYATFSDKNSQSFQKDIIKNIEDANKALSRYVVKNKTQVIDFAMQNLVRQTKSQTQKFDKINLNETKKEF